MTKVIETQSMTIWGSNRIVSMVSILKNIKPGVDSVDGEYWSYSGTDSDRIAGSQEDEEGV